MSVRGDSGFKQCVIFLVLLLGMQNLVLAEQVDQDIIDFKDLQHYAKLSAIAYETETTVRQQSFSDDYKLTHYGVIPAMEIAYFLLTDHTARKQQLVVRGTSNVENAFVDVALKLTMDKYTGVPLHNGFSQAALAIYSQVKAELNRDYIISTTGHSLGGAVAVILAMYLDADKYQTGHSVTFGQPKVTNVAGADKFRHLNITRVVTPRDLVPLVPFIDPMDINDIDIYWHLGKEIVLQEGDSYSVLQGVGSMMRATRFTQKPLSEDNLKNHQMVLYLSMLENKVLNAQQVPFTHSLNLFNLFGGEK